jgi:short-subunit dehydrogenase
MPYQTIWITGASSGIGEALAVRFAREQVNLVLSARREDQLQRVAKRCIEAGLNATQILILPLDITASECLPAAAEQVVTQWGSIDLLINNAGISQRSLCVDTDLSVYQKLFEVDVMGPIALTKAVLPHMLAKGSGHLAVTASVAGKIGVPYRTGYCSAKHAMMGFFDALRTEVEPLGIAVSTIVPGFIRTEISRHALTADGSEFDQVDADIAGGMDVEQCAQAIYKGLKSRKREITVGRGKEMAAPLLKRISPELVFRLTRLKRTH